MQTADTPHPSVILHAIFCALEHLGFGGPVALVGQMERELVGRARLAHQGRDARSDCRVPIAPRTPCHPSRYLHLLFARGFLGSLGRRVGIHPAEFSHRGGLRRALCALRCPAAGHGDFLWCESGRDRTDPSFLLSTRETRDGRLLCSGASPRPALSVTVVLQAEVARLFIAAGVLGVLVYGTLWRRPPRSTTFLVAVPVGARSSNSTILGKLLLFFLKAGALTFGSGLVIVPFLQQGVVQEHGWLGEREFLVAVAIGMISPGPCGDYGDLRGLLGRRILGSGRGDSRHILALLSC